MPSIQPKNRLNLQDLTRILLLAILNMTNMGIVMSLHADLRSPAVPPQREVSALFGGAL